MNLKELGFDDENIDDLVVINEEDEETDEKKSN